MPQPAPITSFLRHHYRHFNAATLIDAADGYIRHLDAGGKMMVTLAGAMSTAELGLSLAEMIRRDKVHAITCTGANLEEDIFNLVAHDYYERVPHYRDLTPHDEKALLDRHMNRVTDTCIPEMEAMRRIGRRGARGVGGRRHGRASATSRTSSSTACSAAGKLEQYYQIDPKDSWMLAACEKNLPIFVPGWEDSTLGNMYAGHCITGDVKHVHTVRTGIEYMMTLAEWYTAQQRTTGGGIGFFQIGGGIAGDFPICVVPMLHQDLQRPDVPVWALLLPDHRLDHELRLLFRRRAQREDHLGQARHRHAEVHHRERRQHRRAADVRDDPGGVAPPGGATVSTRFAPRRVNRAPADRDPDGVARVTSAATTIVSIM